MFCGNCGKELRDGAAFCPHCGAATRRAEQRQAESNGLGSGVEDAPTAAFVPVDVRVRANGGCDGTSGEVPVVNGSGSGRPIQRKRGLRIIAAAVVVGVALGIGAFAAFPGGSTSPVSAQSESSANEAAASASSTGTASSASGSSRSSAAGDAARDGAPSVKDKLESSENVVELSPKASNGEVLFGEVRRDENDYVLADSDTHEYTHGEIESLELTDAELCVAWNEPYARGGYHFFNSDLQAYFESCNWYHDKGEGVEVPVTEIGEANSEMLQSIANENDDSNRWRSLEKE